MSLSETIRTARYEELHGIKAEYSSLFHFAIKIGDTNTVKNLIQPLSEIQDAYKERVYGSHSEFILWMGEQDAPRIRLYLERAKAIEDRRQMAAQSYLKMHELLDLD